MKFSLTRLLLFVGLIAQPFPNAALAETAASSYLVARHADRQSDFSTAAEYYLDALFFDPENTALAQGAVDALMALGDFEMAAELSEDLVDAGVSDAAIYMAIIADAAIEEDYQRITNTLDRTTVATNELTDRLVLGWALLGNGQKAEAFSVFQQVVDDDRFRALGLNHFGLSKAYAGEYDDALAAFNLAAARNFQSPRAIIAEAQILAHLERRNEAARRVKEVLGENPETEELLSRIESGQPVAFDLVASPAEGMAEIFFTLADALNGETPNLFNLFYAQMASEIRPHDSAASLLVAEMLEQLGRTTMARDAYLDIDEGDPAFYTAARGVAETLRAEGQLEEAAAHLNGVVTDIGPGPYILVTLGDLQRQLKAYDEAVEAYTLRLNSEIRSGYQDWYVYYVRGISYERLGMWEKAEADFRQSLALQPSQPQVLNYLGYSLVERREKLDEALSMIEEAVALRPDSGYIVDSLGWVFYRLGRFEDAVVPMELAVELMATDPIVNDHLGDVYWKVGREYEARFQWQRALSFDPEPNEAERIRRKLDVGLDVVLEQEKTAND